MAKSAERPQRYVCTSCQMLHAGTVVEEVGGGFSYEPPGECGACGGTELLREERYPHLAQTG